MFRAQRGQRRQHRLQLRALSIARVKSKTQGFITHRLYFIGGDETQKPALRRGQRIGRYGAGKRAFENRSGVGKLGRASAQRPQCPPAFQERIV